MGWSTIGDLCIHDGRLLGGACYENSVAVWVADISLIEPYGARLPSEKHIPLKQKSDSRESPSEKGESYAKSKSNLHPTPPDTESKEIKTIYVDSVDLVTSKKAGSLESPNIALPSCTKEINTVGTQKQGSVVTMPAKSSLPPNNKSRTVPSIIPRDGPDAKELFNSRRESIVSVNARGGIRTKPTHTRRLSNNQFDMERMLTLESTWHGADDNLKDPLEGRRTKTETVKEKLGTELLNRSKAANSVRLVNGVAVAHGRTRSLVERFESKEMLSGNEMHAHDSGSRAITELVQTSPLKYSDAEIIKKEEPAVDDNDVIEVLNQNHDVLLSTFRSRLTKLQAVRYIWDRNDVEGAVNALKKLPEHSVQADFISILLRRMEIITLDLFSCLLPVLVGLLESKVERHANISLEMLLKLVAVFGPLVRSTVSAPPAIGVDLHAEQRRECCKECFVHFQNIQRILPALIRKGGVVAKSARELNLVLQET